MNKNLKLAIAQIAPVWLDKEKTMEKVIEYISEAAKESPDLIVFGESLLPGYPYWLSLTHGANFNDQIQKDIHRHYMLNAINIENGDLDSICLSAKANKCAIYLGTIERATNRGGHSLYCSLVYIDKEGTIQSVHRKLQPTYEERLCWSPGDGHGLKVHALEDFHVGGLNCWENWMPLSRTALYGMGENLHVAVWPGCLRNTVGITRFIAEESRSYVVSVSGLFSKKDIGDQIPHHELIRAECPEVVSNGGSCLAGPDGKWIIEPVIDQETILYAELDLKRVYEERQNFDPTGHYSRPDVLKLQLDNKRQSVVEIKK